MDTILHVEADQDVQDIVRLSFGFTETFEIIQFKMGYKVIRRATDIFPNIILLGMKMPDMTGVEVLAALRKYPHLSTTPAIFMTADANASHAQRLIKEGACDVVIKPFDPMALEDRITKALTENGRKSVNVDV
jgi:DNA-binding response OmpR family regulator